MGALEIPVPRLTNHVHDELEANHTAKRTDRAIYDTANKGCIQFIVDMVSETSYGYLKSPTTFYTAMTSLQFFTDLISN